MARLFLDEYELKRLGFGPKNIATLRALTEFLNTVNDVAAAQDAISDQQDAIDELAEDTNLSLESLDARVDTLEDDATALGGRVGDLESDMAHPIEVQDEGGSASTIKRINFVGAGVTASVVGTTVTVTIP